MRRLPARKPTSRDPDKTAVAARGSRRWIPAAAIVLGLLLTAALGRALTFAVSPPDGDIRPQQQAAAALSAPQDE